MLRIPKAKHDVKGSAAMGDWLKEQQERAAGLEKNSQGRRGPPKKFSILPDLILDNPKLSSQEKLVLWSLKRHDFKGGECRPPLFLIQKETGYCRPVVRAALKSLGHKGFFKKQRRFGRASLYKLNY
jgi:hypothetical protein